MIAFDKTYLKTLAEILRKAQGVYDKEAKRDIHIGGEVVVIRQWCDEAAARIRELELEVEATKAWKEEVLEGLGGAGIYRADHNNDPKQALHDLICWEVSVALDPRVSQAARDLTADGWVGIRGEKDD